MRVTTALIVMGLMMAGSAAQAQPVDGARLFATRCGACHWDPAKPGEQMRTGPSLKGVFGRKAATQTNFKRYSKALAGSGKTWNEQALNAYLEAPMKAVPGTYMAFPGLKKPEERAAVIAYLKAHASAR